MAGAVAVFVAVSLAVAVTSIVLVLLKSVVMACWRDIVAYNHLVKSTTRKGLSADLRFLSERWQIRVPMQQPSVIWVSLLQVSHQIGGFGAEAP